MSGGIVKLVATGDQDAWLTGKPEISFYRSAYRKYTHYANSVERQIIQGGAAPGGISTIRFEKKGDLLSYVYFTATDTNGAVITNLDWTQVFDKFELLIGGQVVDTQDIEYMTDIEPVTGAQTFCQRPLNYNSTLVNNQKATFLPLKFFFCKDWSVCLPLIALQYHDVEVRITWSSYLTNYLISYDTYSIAAPVVATIPGAGSAVTGANPVTGTGAGTVLNNTSFLFGSTTLTADIVQSFTYTSGTAQLIPGMVFTSFSGALTATVSSVTSTTSTSGTCVMFFSSVPSNGTAFNAVTKSPSSYATATQTGGSFAIAGSVVTATNQTVYPGVTLAGLTAANGVIVNSIVSSFTTPLGASVVAYISAVTIYAAAGTSATVTLTLGGGTITNGVTIVATSSGLVTPNYPVVNLLVGSASGNISTGQSILGVGSGATLATQTIPSVNTVFSSTLISVNYTTPFVSATAANINTYFASCLTAVGGLTFLPATYLAGVITQANGISDNGSSGGLTTTGGTTVALSYANGTLSTAATLGGYVFQTNSMKRPESTPTATVLTSPYVSVSTAATSLGIQYTAANNSGVAIVQYSQFAIIPQNFTGIGQLSAAQPVVDDASIAVIQLNKVVASSATAVAAGQEIVGLTYTGPVVVSKVLASSGTFTTGTGVLTLEVSFPNQKSAGSSTSGAGTAIFFIDPSLALGPGVTTSPIPGGNPTYASLQYQCWSNFVYLDQAERDWFAKSTHDLLITQVQRAVIGNSPTQELAFAQPVKFIAFPAVNYSQLYSASSSTAVNYQFKTQINGVDVGESRGLPHWVDVPLYYHTQYGYMHSGTMPTVAVISYCLDTSKLQPTGTLNFSRIDTFRIVTPPILTNGVLGLCPSIKYPTPYMYAVNYNVLRIQNGTGGLLYAS